LISFRKGQPVGDHHSNIDIAPFGPLLMSVHLLRRTRICRSRMHRGHAVGPPKGAPRRAKCDLGRGDCP
jgi:hypothetical protein